MSAKRHAGTNGETIANQAAQIHSWIQQADLGDRDVTVSQAIENADKWIDPSLSTSANWAIIKKRLGIRTAGDREKIVRDAKDKARDSARRAILETLDDVADEYGDDFVAEAIDAAGIDQAGRYRDELAGAPEPKEWSPSAVGASPTDAPDPAPAPEPEPEPADASEPEPVPLRARLLGYVPAPMQTLCIVLYVLLRYSPDSGVSSEVTQNA